MKQDRQTQLERERQRVFINSLAGLARFHILDLADSEKRGVRANALAREVTGNRCRGWRLVAVEACETLAARLYRRLAASELLDGALGLIYRRANGRVGEENDARILRLALSFNLTNVTQQFHCAALTAATAQLLPIVERLLLLRQVTVSETEASLSEPTATASNQTVVSRVEMIHSAPKATRDANESIAREFAITRREVAHETRRLERETRSMLSEAVVRSQFIERTMSRIEAGNVTPVESKPPVSFAPMIRPLAERKPLPVSFAPMTQPPASVKAGNRDRHSGGRPMVAPPVLGVARRRETTPERTSSAPMTQPPVSVKAGNRDRHSEERPMAALPVLGVARRRETTPERTSSKFELIQRAPGKRETDRETDRAAIGTQPLMQFGSAAAPLNLVMWSRKAMTSSFPTAAISGEKRAEGRVYASGDGSDDGGIQRSFTSLRRAETVQPAPLGYALVQPQRATVAEERVIKPVEKREVVEIVQQEVKTLMSKGSPMLKLSSADYARITDQVCSALAGQLLVERERLGPRF
jgi:hypothetical protein